MSGETLPGLLRQRAGDRADHRFLVAGERSFTFVEMDRLVDRLAGGLAERGVQHGDRVALLTTNRWEVVATFLATLRLGAIHVPLNAYLKGEVLRHPVLDAAPRLLVGDEAGLRAIRGLGLDDPPTLVALDADEQGAVAFGDLLDVQPSTPFVAREPGGPASIVYTSGTTGPAKGCVLPHGYYVNAARLSSSMLGYTPADVVLTALPLWHGWALGIVSAALTHGFTAVIEESFSPSAFRQRWAEVGATIVSGVGAMIVALASLPPSPEDTDHDLRTVFSFPLSEEQRRAFVDRFGVEPFGQMYGQTETGAIAFSRLDQPADPRGVGFPSPAYEVRLVGEDGRDVAAGEPGELVVRARQPDTMFLGYWRGEGAPPEAPGDGWHRTGDLVRRLEDGSLAFVDRKADALRRRGENVSSLDVERALTSHPAIAEAAVHAVPSAMTEDDIKACLVLEPKAALTPHELFAHVADRLPYYAVPRYVEVLEELPTTATMRVRKHELRERGVTEGTWDLEAMGLVVERDQRR